MAISSTGVRFDFFGRDVSAGRTADQVERRFSGLGRSISGVTAGLATGAVAAAAGLGTVVTKAADYDKTIRKVAVITGESGQAMKGLSDLAMKMGADTVFSAGDAANAMLELAKGGMSAAIIQGGALEATMKLAAAGELQMGDAATYVANSLQMFGLRASDSARVATALAGGANASSASVESLGLALSQVGPGAKLAGASLEETVGILSAFDAAGIKGSDAGTSFKTMLSRLVPTTAGARDMMRELGLKFTDASGRFVPMRDVAEQLQQKLAKLTPEMRSTALTTIFGSDAFRAAAIMAELGAEGVDKYTAAAKDQKAATDLANVGMQGASGAIEQFKGGIETLAIQIGTGILPAFTKVLTGINEKVLPGIGNAISGVGGFVSRVDWKGIGDDIKRRMPDIDWSGIGEDLRADASTWGGALIAGVKTGFESGDWGPLGRTLGDGIGKALDSAVVNAGKMTRSIVSWFGAVDWFDVGAAVGKQAAPFAIGFLSKLGENLITTAKEHPMDTAIAITSFLGIGKIAGVIGKVLGKIPLLRAFAPFFTKWNELTGPLNNAIGGFLRAVGRGFMTGLGALPLGSQMKKKFMSAAETIGLHAMYAAGQAKKFVLGIPEGIGRGLGSVTRAVFNLIGRILSPFRNAVEWLVDEGRGTVSGLVRGFTERFPRVTGAIRAVIRLLTAPFRGSGNWLQNAGNWVIGGLRAGIGNAMRGIGGWIKRVVVDPIIRNVKSFFGIKSPSRVMMGIGGHLITGLVQGMMRGGARNVATKVFGSMPKALGALVNKGLVNIASLPSRAMKALSGLGGKFLGMLDGLGGWLKGSGGGNSAGLVAFGRWLQAMGYTVTEHPAFGGVTMGAHTNGSAHYSGRAIDVNRGAGTSATEQAWLAKIIPSAHKAGFKTIFMAPGHYNHAHIAMATGGVIREPVFGRGLRSGKSYSFGERGDETVIPGVPRAGRGGGDLHVHVHLDGPVAGSKLAMENMVVAAVDSARGKGRIRA